MKKTFFLVALCMVLLLVSATNLLSAPKGEISISGTYYLQGVRTCVQTDYNDLMGFDNTFMLLQSATTRTYHNEGTLVLTKDGTGTAALNVMAIIHQATDAGYQNPTKWSGNCDVSYGSQEDGTTTMTFEGCTGTYRDKNWLEVTTGSDGYTVNVVVSGTMLFLSGTEYSYPPEVAWRGNDNTTYHEAERECARTLTAVKIGN